MHIELSEKASKIVERFAKEKELGNKETVEWLIHGHANRLKASRKYANSPKGQKVAAAGRKKAAPKPRKKAEPKSHAPRQKPLNGPAGQVPAAAAY